MITDKDKTESILIVDDETKNIQLLGSLLSEKSYEIEIAMNGSEALNWLEERSFDLILLDIMMPGMDGYEVCRRIKSNPNSKNIPVIFLTAKTETDDIIKAFETGAADYVQKPFKTLELLSRIRNHLTIGHQRKELEKLNASKDKFFSIISHDLRSPFNTLFGMIELFNDDLLESPEDLKEMMNDLKSVGDHIFKLLNSLLEWAQLQRHTDIMETQKINLSDILKNTAELFRETARKKGISFEMNLQTEGSYEILGDENMLSTVFRNIINNAVKFTRSGGKISISCQSVSSDFFEIRISDTGVGISDTDIAKLFHIEHKMKSTGTAGEIGTGLGLIICKEFIDRHQGFIYAESKLGEGTAFIVQLKKNLT